MLPIKWRLVIAGCIVSSISIVLMITKGVATPFVILLVVGVVVLLVGLLLVLRARR